MESMETENMSVADEPEGGSIVQADNTGETMVLQGVANDGEPSSSGNSSWQWTSMLRLMEQETNTHTSTSSFLCSTAPSTASSYMTCTAADKQQSALCSVPPSLMSSGCFPSQSLLHDQPCMDMLSADQNAFGTSDPDVWAQEFLSGPIGEQKSTNFPCAADDGLQELLYPRTVLELLFSDQLKIDQMPSWPDILQAHRASAGSATVEFAHPMASEKTNMEVSAAPHEKYASGTGSPQIDAKVLHYIPTYSSLLSGTVDDRMSSSTASSTLSDNAIDQWPVPASSAPQCDTHAALLSSSQSMSSLMQQIDPTCIKQEHIDQPLSPFGEKGNGFEGSMTSIDYEQKPTNLLISKLWNSAVFNGNDPLLTHINHKHHIYESITAANFSQNLRQTAGMTTASNCNLQTMNSMQNAAGNHVAGHMYHLHQQSDQRLDKKPRSFNDVGGGNGIGSLDVSYGIHMHEKERVAKRIIRKEDENPNELEQDTKPSMQALLMETNEACLNIMMHNPNKEEDQGVGVECKLKRSRIEHSMPPPTTSTSSNNKSTTFKSQPMRKEKLSERITTLQQLVSPFGKTDTASVLLEAIGYIKFLQEQVQALSSPYLKRPASQNLVQGEKGQVDEESKRDLRSRGLCLVPLACTLQVANDNGADYWYGSSYR